MEKENRHPKTYTYDDLPQWVKHYHQKGMLNLIPLQKGTKDKTVEKWKQYQKEMYPMDKLQEHKGNFAAIMGAPVPFGAYLTIIDIDKKNLYPYFEGIDSIHVESPKKGYHIWLYSKNQVSDINIIKKEFGLDIELRGKETGYCLVPPSHILHERGELIDNGHRVIKERDIEPFILEVDDAYEFVTEILLSAGFKKRSSKNGVDLGTSIEKPEKHDKELTDDEIKKLIEILKLVYIPNHRNNLVLALVGDLWWNNYSSTAANKFIEQLTIHYEDTTSERLKLVERTYDKAKHKKQKIAGKNVLYSEMISVFQEANGKSLADSEKLAEKTLNEWHKVIKLKNAEKEETHVNLAELDLDDLFGEVDEDKRFIKVKEPIFAIDDKLYYVTKTEKEFGKGRHPLACVYGPDGGIGVLPYSLENPKSSDSPFPVIENAVKVEDTNQHQTILRLSENSIKTCENVEKMPENLSFFNGSQERVMELWSESGREDELPKLIRNKIKYYIYLDDPILYYLITAWFIGTYMFPLFDTFGMLIFSGEKGTGKGTAMDVANKIVWNPSGKLIGATEPVLFRTIESQRPTLLLDEYHRLIGNKELKNGIEGLIESGYERGGSVKRLKEVKGRDGKDYEEVRHQVYCPKILVTRVPTEADDKALKIIIPKLELDTEYAKKKQELHKDKFFDIIRGSIMEWVQKNTNEIMETLECLEPNLKVNGRDFAVLSPTLAICKVAFLDKYDEIENFVGNYIQKKRKGSSEAEMNLLLALKAVYDNAFGDGKEGIPNQCEDGGTYLKDLKSYHFSTNILMGTLRDDFDHKTNYKGIESALDNLKIRYRFIGGKGFYISSEDLHKKFTEKGLATSDEVNTDIAIAIPS